jgi:hypothetical protein
MQAIFLRYLLPYLLTTCSRFPLEKLTGSQLVKKFPGCYGTRSFITTFTNALLSLIWASSTQALALISLSEDSSLHYPPICICFFQVTSFPPVYLPKPCIHLCSILSLPLISLSEYLPLYYPPIYICFFQVVSLPPVSLPKSCIHLCSPTYVLHTPSVLFLSTWSPGFVLDTKKKFSWLQSDWLALK